MFFRCAPQEAGDGYCLPQLIVPCWPPLVSDESQQDASPQNALPAGVVAAGAQRGYGSFCTVDASGPLA